MLFASFFTAYFFVRFNVADQWPPLNDEGEPFELPVVITGVNTAILVSSSFTDLVGRAPPQALQRPQGRSSAACSSRSCSGATFLIIQINEYVHLGFTPAGQGVRVGLLLPDRPPRAARVRRPHPAHASAYIRVKKARDFSLELGDAAHGEQHLLALRRRRLGAALHPRLPHMSAASKLRAGRLAAALALAAAGAGRRRLRRRLRDRRHRGRQADLRRPSARAATSSRTPARRRRTSAPTSTTRSARRARWGWRTTSSPAWSSAGSRSPSCRCPATWSRARTRTTSRRTSRRSRGPSRRAASARPGRRPPRSPTRRGSRSRSCMRAAGRARG